MVLNAKKEVQSRNANFFKRCRCGGKEGERGGGEERERDLKLIFKRPGPSMWKLICGEKGFCVTVGEHLLFLIFKINALPWSFEPAALPAA